MWLRMHGAHVTGIALESETVPGLLDQLRLHEEIEHHIVDIRDAKLLTETVSKAEPEIVFHLAAQALVRRSYRQPLETWNTNVTGSIHLMDSLRYLESPFVAIMVTSDKVYLNREWNYAYRETDPLGGYDPYSSSKAACEIAVASWRSSFFANPLKTAIATVRAGNVLGGGDWAEDRIVPDLVRSFRENRELAIRSPDSTRPWQHVLEPLTGYAKLAEQMRLAQQNGQAEKVAGLCEGWNFGPLPESNRTVRELADTAIESWPGNWSDQSNPDLPHEAKFLGLSIDKSCRELDWYPRWGFRQCVGKTIEWYRRVHQGEHPRTVTEEQICDYERHALNSTPISAENIQA